MRLKPSISWLLIFIPVSLALENTGGVSPTVVFFSAALSIVPIATFIVRATEQIAHRTGDTIGGLLNATFGNVPELIICVVALRAGLVEMVQASLIGAVLANLLLTLGLSFFLGGRRHHIQEYNPVAARLYGTMMMIAVISMIVPSSFHNVFSAEIPVEHEENLSLAVAVVLLIAYALNLLFMLKTHPELFKSASSGHEAPEGEKLWSVGRAVGTLVAASALAAWMSEILVGAAEGAGEALGMSQVFIGIVILAIVGGAAESGSAIAMARKNKVDLTIGIALGSCIQITLFVAPLLVLTSLAVSPKPMLLTFGRTELGALFFAVLMGVIIAGDGRSHWYKGIQLLVVYLIIASMFYFIPS